MTAYATEEHDAPKSALPGPRSEQGQMDDEELQGILSGLLNDSVAYVDGVLSPARSIAHKYFKSEPFGNEEIGRSQVIMPEVANAVTGMMPELMRIFTGPKHYVEFEPASEKSTDIAAQITDYVRFVIEKDNPGFRIIHDSMWDGLVKRTGIVKWGWEDYCEEFYCLRNVTDEQFAALEADDSVTISTKEKEEHQVTRYPTDEELQAWQEQMQQAQQQMQQGGAPMEQIPMPQPQEVDAYSVEVVYKIASGRARVWAVPPEELLVLRQSRNLEDALYIGHRMVKTDGELRAMGVSEEDIEEHGGKSNILSFNTEEITRQPDSAVVIDAPPAGDANDQNDYIEHYVKIDFNGDGRQELRLICTIGTGNHIVSNKIISHRPFATWGPYPEPHQIIARSVADRTLDLQKINSALVRSGLDSLAASIFPRSAYQENMVSLADLQNTEIGATIRTKGQPDAVLKSFQHTFPGKEIFSFLEFFRSEKEARVGNTGAQGLDMDALQSTDADAAKEAIDSNKMQIELIARHYAENIMKPMFRGLMRLLIENQDGERIVRLRGKMVPMQPDVWDADMDVTVKVAVGRLEERKLNMLMGVKADQDAILQMFGPSAPMTSLVQAYNTRIDILRIQGILDVDRYYTDPSNWQPPQQGNQPSPEQVLAQAEMEIKKMETMGKLAVEHEKLKFAREEAAGKLELDKQKLAADVELRKFEIESRWKTQISDQMLTAEIERQRMLIDQQQGRHEVAADLLSNLHATETQADVDMHATMNPPPAAGE